VQWKNSPVQFGHISVLMHWLVALFFYAMFALGLWMVGLGYYDDWYHRAPELHKSIGVALFLVMVFRLLWRFISPPPSPLKSFSAATRIGAWLAHLMLFLGIFTILISGYLISTAEGQPINVFGWFEIPATLFGLNQQADIAGVIHLWVAWGIVIVSVLHGLAAFKHHFIDRDTTLTRMLGRQHRSD
jgi:cytochrome b561